MITMMTTKDDDKSDEQKAQRSKNNSKINQRTTQVNQEQLKSSRIKKNSRFKKKAQNQESRFKISRIKIKIQDSRFNNEEKTQSR